VFELVFENVKGRKEAALNLFVKQTSPIDSIQVGANAFTQLLYMRIRRAERHLPTYQWKVE
jgi:hypothetical protein